MESIPNDSTSVSGDEPLFTCDAIDTDELPMRVIGQYGLVVYVRPTSGSLPAPITNVVCRIACPPSSYVATVPARLIMPAGRIYHVTLLAALPPLSQMRAAVRAQFRPPSDIAPDAQPVVLEGLPVNQWFRPREGQLVATGEAELRGHDMRVARSGNSRHDARKVVGERRSARFMQQWEISEQGRQRAFALRRWADSQPGDVATDAMLAALRDEALPVRSVASHWVADVADQLPLSKFLGVLKEKGVMNANEWLAAAYVYAAHADEVPVEAVFDLYHGDYGWLSPAIHRIAIETIGNMGERAPDDAIALLASIVSEQRTIYDIRVRNQAARSLGKLGGRAPVEALITSMRNGADPAEESESARALARHPANIPTEIREEARLLSDYATARRVYYQRIFDRLPQMDRMAQAPNSPSKPRKEDD